MKPPATKRIPMNSLRKTALIAGGLYLLTFISSIPAVFLLAPVLDNPDYIIGSGNDTRVLLGCLLDLINAFACIGTAVALFPVVKRQNEGVALGFVTSRVMEAAIIVIGVVSLLSIVTLRQDLAGTAGADPAALVTTGQSLVATRDWTFLLGPDLMAGINALLLGSLMYRSRLVPRVIPSIGLIGGPLLICRLHRNPVRRLLPGLDHRGPGRPVGVLARRLPGRQRLQALPHHHWNDHPRHPDRNRGIEGVEMSVARRNAVAAGEAAGARKDLMKAIVQDHFGPPDTLQLVDVADARDRSRRRAAQGARRRGQPLRLAHAARRPTHRPPDGRRRPDQAEGPDRGRRRRRAGSRRSAPTCTTCGPATRSSASPGAPSPSTPTADAALVVPKPAGLSFEQAAAMPMAAVTALHAIRDRGRVQPGQRVLVNGAAGGVGTFAVQIAAALGAEVTGVCSARNVDLVRSIGATHVVDYASEDFADGPVRYDVILDNVGNRTIRDLRRAVTPTGTIIVNGGGSPGHIIGAVGRILRCGRGQPVRPSADHHGPDHVEPGGSARRDRTGRGRHPPVRHRPDLPAGRHGGRDCGTSRRDMPAARSSSRCPEHRPPHRPLGRMPAAGHASTAWPAWVIAAAMVARPTVVRGDGHQPADHIGVHVFVARQIR